MDLEHVLELKREICAAYDDCEDCMLFGKSIGGIKMCLPDCIFDTENVENRNRALEKTTMILEEYENTRISGIAIDIVMEKLQNEFPNLQKEQLARIITHEACPSLFLGNDIVNEPQYCPEGYTKDCNSCWTQTVCFTRKPEMTLAQLREKWGI